MTLMKSGDKKLILFSHHDNLGKVNGIFTSAIVLTLTLI